MARYTANFLQSYVSGQFRNDTDKFIELRSVRETLEDYDAITDRIREVFKKELYLPLLKILSIPTAKLSNSRDSLLRAIQQGVITYADGTFQGSFNSHTSKELRDLGAKWDRKTSTYKLSETKLTLDVREAVSTSQARFIEKLKQLDVKLQKILPAEIANKLKIEDIFDSQLWKVDKAVKKTLENITVTPTLTKDQRQQIAAEWQGNMDLWIKDFAEEQIKELRKSVRDSVFKGNRYESLVKSIQDNYGVTSNKAKFLARQETNLLMAKFKETRYEDAGVFEYRWRCVAGSKNHPVRPSHLALNGKIFRFDTPPVTTDPSEPQRRNNPGEDYNCRCYAVPVIRKK